MTGGSIGAVALTAKQRRALPASAFVYPSSRKYPVPTKAQAKRAGISERQRVATLRSALSRAAQSGTSGSTAKVKPVVQRRAAGKVASVKPRPRGSTRRPPGTRRRK